MKELYKDCLDALRKNRRYLRFSFGGFFIVVLFSMVYVLLMPGEKIRLIKDFVDQLSETLISNTGGKITWYGIFANNIRAAFIGGALGAVPYLFLPWFAVAVNGLILGVLPAYLHRTGTSIVKTLVFGILPHGILEIPAVLISFAFGFLICRKITNLVMGKEKSSQFKEAVVSFIKVYALIIVPVLLIAALIEAYVTPVLLRMFG